MPVFALSIPTRSSDQFFDPVAAFVEAFGSGFKAGGSVDDGINKHGHGEKIIIDIGEELPEEKTIKAGQIFNPEELEKMWGDYDEDQVMELYAFEASMRTPAEISKRFFCDTINNLDSEAIKLTRYKRTY